ncbi:MULTISPECIES: efflux RND transporter periplasmic adaptor subunit [unclassified Thiocapsa]|uniref:efflux RND transporter periplasmic adaptor subunit n=1 Tax=unclassified Thiocapsa TaxID=2641286 RepID=UPI0035B4C9BC
MKPSNGPADTDSASPPLPLLDDGRGSPEPATPPRRPRAIVRAAAVLLLIFAGGVLGLYFQPPGLRAFFSASGLEPGAGARVPIALPVERTPSPERVAAVASGDVMALGRLRPRDDIVTVATPFGAADARIAQLLVSDGDDVIAGDLLAVLDSMVQFEAALATAQSTLETRQAKLAQTISNVAAAEAETRASLESARVAASAAQASLARARSLSERGLTSQEALDAAQSDAAAASGEVARLTATLSRYDTAPDGEQADVAVARADVAAAEAEFARATRDLELARIRAPRDGRVLEIAAREGEKAPPEGLLQLGDVGRMEAALEVFESMAPRVQVGQDVKISSKVLGDTPLRGKVTRIGALVGRQSVTADDPAANTDARIVEVIVQLDDPSSARAARFVGLEVVGRIGVETSGYVTAGAP